MVRTLRRYQQEAVDAIHGSWLSGVTRTGIVMATGLGKTSVIGKIATDEARAGGRVLCLAHRGELLDQISATCQAFASDIPVGRVQAGRNEGRRPITVAMAQTLASEKRRQRLRPPTKIIVDECHHAASPSYMQILSWAGAFDHTPTLGVTATMTRGDRRGLGDVWQEVCFSRDIQFGIKNGYLVEPRGRAVVTDHMDLNAAKVSRGDYQDNELGEMVAQDTDQIVKAWQEHAADRLTVAFVPTVDSARALTDEFRAVGVPVGEVYGSTSQTERQSIYTQLAKGTIRVLVNVMVATEGFDCPPLSCILMARPTRLPGLYQQIVGRGLRPAPETGKTDCLVLDVVGASRFQKLATLVDLHPTAKYDTTELDDLPCPDCGGYLRDASEAAPYPCTCQAEEEIFDGGALRDPNAGRRRLIGPAEYEDLDMFATSELNWLFTRAGVRFLPCGDRMAILWADEATGLFQAGHCTVRGYDNGVYVGRDGHGDPAGTLPLNQARQRAEEWALAEDPTVATRAASWRKRGGLPSDKQVEFAAKLGIAEPETMNKARLSDEISIALASRVLDQ